jgi:leader peptidase (prepilin peptidase)/N-methyltransferase
VLVAQTAIEPSVEWLLGALGASTFLFVAALVHPRGMGMGDVKLALLLGAMLGRNVAVAMMLGMLFALVPAAALAVRHGSRVRKMEIPFAPFLALGAVVALFAGEPILDWYLGLLD